MIEAASENGFLRRQSNGLEQPPRPVLERTVPSVSSHPVEERATDA
jgi:hypothetical protein